MTTTERALAGPERPGGQGLDHNQQESGDRAIVALLTDDTHGPTDFVATYRHAGSDSTDGHGPDGQAAYEVWSQRGMVRFRRFLDPAGGYGYEVIEQIGENPIANQDPTAVATIAEEIEASTRSGLYADDPNRAFMAPASLSYPLAYERLAQLFDSPNAPDLVINPHSYAYGRQPGQHGALDVVQSRAPLVFSGPGVKDSGRTDAIVAHVDVAPTLAKLLGLPLIDGKDATGRTSSERGADPDVYLRRQDGRPLDEIIDADGERPERAYIFLLDGLSNTELKERLERDREAIPNLARLIERGLMFNYGATVNFPSITWPSHNAIGTGAWCGHHDVVNPTYYLRETRETVTPQGTVWETGRFVTGDVETFYEAVHRVFGKWDGQTGAITASLNEPCMRGAGHATLERRSLVDDDKFRELTRANREDTNPRWKAEGQESVHRYSYTDIMGTVQSMLLFGSDDQPPPKFTFHEYSLTDAAGHDYGPHSDGLRDALIETDKRIGKVLDVLDARGLFDSTLFVITTDHGMAPVDTALAANQAQAVTDAGLSAVTHMPLVYLIDMDVTVEHARDGRTATITIVENDPTPSGDPDDRPPVPSAEVEVISHGGKVVAKATTDAHGVCGLPLAVDEDPEHIVLAVRHDKFNTRHLRLDGTNVVEDIRQRLYGGGA
ncbi:MAG: alkaline phosphatase family protein [Dehalococcoidia bacterium]